MDFVSVTNNKIMKTVLKSDLYKLVEIGEVEVFTPAQLKSYVEMSNDSISKSEGSKDELYKSVVGEMRSFEPVTMWDDKDLQKSVVMVRPAQIAWDNKGDDIEKSLSGRFLDTDLNRKFDRVGLHYPMVDPIEKAKKAVIGEIREWSDGKYRRTAKGWEYIKGSDPKKKTGSVGKGEDTDYAEMYEKKKKELQDKHGESGEQTSDDDKIHLKDIHGNEAGGKEESQFDKFQMGDTVKLNDDVNLVSLSSMKGHNLKVIKLVSGTSTVPVFFRVESDMGEVAEINPNYLSKVDKTSVAERPIPGDLKHNVKFYDSNFKKAQVDLKAFAAANGMKDSSNNGAYKNFPEDDIIRSLRIDIATPTIVAIEQGDVATRFKVGIGESTAGIPNKYLSKIQDAQYDTPEQTWKAAIAIKKKFEDFFQSI